jgi:hypothetical protein
MTTLAMLALSTRRPAEPRQRRLASRDRARVNPIGSRSPGRGPAPAGRDCAVDTRARAGQRRACVGRRASVRRRAAHAHLRAALGFSFGPPRERAV